MRHPLRLFALVSLLVLAAADAGAQLSVRRPTKDASANEAADPSGVVKVALTIGGRRWEGMVPGQCKHAAAAAIYDTPASLWSVVANERGAASNRSLGFTMWRIKETGADQMNFSVSQGNTRHEIATIKGVRRTPGPQLVGSGTVTLEPRGAGGVFTIDGTTGGGARVTGTLECARFGGVYAEGG
jgi:hypothetical protein